MSQIPDPQMPGPMPVDPNASVQGPAIGLMVDGGLQILLAIAGILMNLLGVGMNAAAGGNQAMPNMFGGAMGVIGGIIGLAFGVVILLGAMKMKNLQNYTFAMIGTIVAMLPCSACCLLGLPIGIWALVVLMKPEVKAAFTN